MKILYRLYQLFICVPVILVMTIVTSLSVIIGSIIGNGHFWGYYPGKYWSRLIVRILLLPVKVEGRENLDKDQSYVFVSNHQGAFDIFLIYGFLNRNFKWMMKYQLGEIPLVGYACRCCHFIFVDRRGPKRIKATYDKAREILREGMSVVVFPEGSRTFTGHMGKFRRGAFMLADEVGLPVVPLTINGSFNVMPRTRDMKWVIWHPLKLTIHKPIPHTGKGEDYQKEVMKQAYDVIESGLVSEYKGYEFNPDQ